MAANDALTMDGDTDDLAFNSSAEFLDVDPSPHAKEVPSMWARVSLTLCCAAYLLGSVASDAVRVLQLSFREIFTDSQLGMLYGSYALAATVVVLFSGRAIDRFGVGISTVVCSFMCCVGFALQTLGAFGSGVSTSFVLLLVGRFLHGAGGEALFVCWDSVITLWFSAQGISFAMSLYCASGRMGDIFATVALPPLISVLDGRSQVMLLAMGCVLCSFLCNVAVVLIDRYKRPASRKANDVTSFSFSSLTEFTASYWVCVGISTVLYGNIGQLLQFVPTVIEPVFGSVVSPLLMSVTFGVAMIVTPTVGCFLRNEWRFAVVLAGSICLFLSCLTLLFQNRVLLVAGLVLLGLSYAFTSGALWGTINVYQTQSNLGILYAIPYAGFNSWGFVVSIFSGWLLDNFPVWVAVLTWAVAGAGGVLLCIVWFRMK